MPELDDAIRNRPIISSFGAAHYFTMLQADGTKRLLGTKVMPARSLASKTLNYTLLAADAGNLFDNTGATGTVILTLPAWAADPTLRFYFMVTAAQILRVLAPASTRIASGITNSAAAGNIQSATPYSALCLIATSISNQWAVESATGEWTIT